MINIPQYNFAPAHWIEGKLLSGKKLSELVLNDLKENLSKYSQKPGLGVILAGEDPASQIYVNNKQKKAAELGFHVDLIRLSSKVSQQEILLHVDAFNQNKEIHGILVQLPLPSHLDSNAILQAITPEKDADGFHFINLGKLLAGQNGTLPCTPLGMMLMLSELPHEIEGRHAVILGRSNIVGKPMAQLLLTYANCTVTLCHSKTQNISKHIESADILVSAMGKRDVVGIESIKKGAIVLDVGIHRTDKGICGDIDYQKALDRVSFITPVPGGIGPMTIAMLLTNTYKNFLGFDK